MAVRHWRGRGERQCKNCTSSWSTALAKTLNKQKFEVEFIVPAAGGKAIADGCGRRMTTRSTIRDGFLSGKPRHPADGDNPEFDERQLPAEGTVRVLPADPRGRGHVPRICHTAPLGGAGIDNIGTGIAAGRPRLEHPPGQGRHDGHRQGDHSHRNTQAKINKNRAFLIATAIITVFLAMVASYAIVRYVIVKPLRHLRDVSDAISRGNIAQRAEIHTGDEFEELAVAFNRMLRHLVATQDELRQVNANLGRQGRRTGPGEHAALRDEHASRATSWPR